MQIKRVLESKISNELKTTNKGILIYGARQVGKTTLANNIIGQLGLKTLYINGDLQDKNCDILATRNLEKYKQLLADYEMVFVDEAQRIPEVGLILKIILDHFKNIKVIVTGSSALDLRSKVSEPLTGRVYSHYLYPISAAELLKFSNFANLNQNLEDLNIYGCYPETLNTPSLTDKKKFLHTLADGYLYRDMIEFGNIKNSNKIKSLLVLLAAQIGQEVSFEELAQKLELARATVLSYVDLLEKSFVIKIVRGYSRNIRKEITKKPKVYFCDLGVRNALLDNFNELKFRPDAGAIWENFLIMERMKKNSYADLYTSYNFWRLQTGAEIDFIEDYSGKLHAFEFKYSTKTSKVPASFVNEYKDSSFKTINLDNWHEFIT